MDKDNFPFVSIIIPCRNEEKHIGKCLDSIIEQNYPKNRLEILVVDGVSTDGTKKIIEKYIQKYTFIKFLENKRKVVSPGLNIAIKHSRGDFIVIISSHSIYKKDYLPKCIGYIQKYKADNVGGIEIAVSNSNSLIGKSIPFLLSSLFGVGNSYYRIGSKKPKWTDTVACSCYRKEVFDKIGLFNEDLVRNQDIEFNLRLKKTGGRILLVPEIISYYYARSTLKDLFKQNFWNGFWVVYSTKFAKTPFSLRHLVPFFLVLSLIGSLIFSLFCKPFIYFFGFIIALYFILNIFFSFKISLKNGLKYFPTLILSFLILHFSYGIGSLRGVIKLVRSKV